ncbi:hypothetical protein BgiMline_008311, partial [Biomphalaria glabrata]
WVEVVNNKDLQRHCDNQNLLGHFWTILTCLNFCGQSGLARIFLDNLDLLEHLWTIRTC